MESYAVIFAFDISKNLSPITDIVPKPLIKVNGREIIDYQIKGYVSCGVKEENITVVTGYMSDAVEEYLSINYPNINILKSIDDRNSIHTYVFYHVLKSIKDQNEFNINSLFVNNGDYLYDEEFMKEMVACTFDNAIISEKSASQLIGLSKYNQTAVRILFEILNSYIESKNESENFDDEILLDFMKKVKVFSLNLNNKKLVKINSNENLLIADKLFSNFDYKSKKAYIFDLDGTVYLGDIPIVPAIDFIKQNQNIFDFYFLTNNTSKTPNDYVDKLIKFGISATINQIATPLYPLIDYIKANKYKSVYLLANKRVKEFMQSQLPDISFEFDFENNQAIALTFDTEITYEKMKNMSILLNNKNVDYIATHNDLHCPSERGPIPDVGGMINLIKSTNGLEPNIILGKPSVNLIKKYIAKYGIDKIAIAGDRLYTDKKLADNANCDFICVLSGETKRIDVAVDKTRYPSIVVKNLGEITTSNKDLNEHVKVLSL